ncbi:hypothetical protein Pve01_82820 [Planomonospora venezuelensis]|nr:hypothetical protein Pve01_82820 [Planomonospora venezuelensis]
MVLSVVLVVAAWIALSVPAALVVGRMFAAGHVAPVIVGRASAADAGHVAYLSRSESRRTAASRWPHEARVLCASRRGHAAVSAGVGRSAG